MAGDADLRLPAGVAALVVALALTVLVCSPVSGAAQESKEDVELAKLQAEREKAQAEAAKVKRDDSDLWRALGILAPLVTVAVAAGTLIVTVTKNLGDREQERQERRDAADAAALLRDQEREARAAAEKAAVVDRFDERFAAAAAAAAGAHVAQRRSGAVLLGSMTSGSTELSDQAINLILALLQVEEAEPDAGTTRLLIRALERALKATDQSKPLADRFFFTHLRAPELNLAGVDLSGVDLAFSNLTDADLRRTILERSRAVDLTLSLAQLQGARLSHCEWRGVRARGAKFDEATLVGAELVGADLTNADFFKAKLAGANLRGATLRGTKFEQADMLNAMFRSVIIDDRAMKTVVKSDNWQSADWDAAVRTKLEQFAAAQPAP